MQCVYTNISPMQHDHKTRWFIWFSNGYYFSNFLSPHNSPRHSSTTHDNLLGDASNKLQTTNNIILTSSHLQNPQMNSALSRHVFHQRLVCVKTITSVYLIYSITTQGSVIPISLHVSFRSEIKLSKQF